MDTLGIEAFLAVVRQGSLTEAANSLFLSQSTLSHRIAELEREVGVCLIDRGRGFRSLTLTDHGKDFLVIAERWEDLVRDTKQIPLRTKKLALAIGAVDSIHTCVLPPLYKALQEQTHNLSIRLKTHNSTELYLQVDRGELDVAFTLLNLPMRNLSIERFYTEPRVVLRRELSTGSCNELIDLNSLMAEKEILFEGEPAFQAWYTRWKGSNNYPAICVDTAQLLLPLLDSCGVWSIVPLCLAQQLASTGAFTYYRLPDPPPERVCYKIQSQYPKPSAVQSLQLLDSCLATFFIETFLARSKK
ncbi:MAG: LysR family transcriptional regulator [Sporomusaceae bacterium]|nr:LysR family transcriptional regulator [Sporomusaceae bacterium]